MYVYIRVFFAAVILKFDVPENPFMFMPLRVYFYPNSLRS